MSVMSTRAEPPTIKLPLTVRSVNVPVLAVEAPTVVPFTEPPVIATVAAFCVAIVPRPKFVRAVIAEAKSDKLFARNAYVVSAPLAVTPKLVRASVALKHLYRHEQQKVSPSYPQQLVVLLHSSV